jgi:hypothetical protein
MAMRFLFLFLALSAAWLMPLRAQQDGRVAVSKKGIALVKPQAWSPANQARVVKFTAYTDRRARGTSGAGYYVLRLPSGQEAQMQASQVVGELILEVDVPANIITSADRDALQKIVDDMKKVTAIVPAARIDIDQMTKPLEGALVRYYSGEVRVEGDWMALEDYQKREANRIENILKRELREATSKIEFDLPSNSSYRKLREMAATDSDLSARLDAIDTSYKNMVALEEQQLIIAELSKPSLNSNMVASAIEKLKKQPDLSNASQKVISQAETATILADRIDKARAALEEFFATQTSRETIPVIPAELDTQIRDLAKDLREFHAGSPPSAIRIPDAPAKASILTVQTLPGAAPLFDKKDWVAANSILAPLAEMASNIGPRTSAVLKGLQNYSTSQVDIAIKLRADAEMIERTGNKEAAIAKLNESMAAMPNPEVAAKIEELQKN